jgi:hypothetical protein
MRHLKQNLENSIILDSRHRLNVSQADAETTVLEKIGNKKCQVASELPSVENAKYTKASRGIIRLLKIKDGDKLLALDETILDLAFQRNQVVDCGERWRRKPH